MTNSEKLRDREIRNIAMKYLNERDPDLRTEEPLPVDYEAFREEVHGEAGKDDISRFEEEWADIYAEMEEPGYR